VDARLRGVARGRHAGVRQELVPGSLSARNTAYGRALLERRLARQHEM
jgi:hypothetical protein